MTHSELGQKAGLPPGRVWFGLADGPDVDRGRPDHRDDTLLRAHGGAGAAAVAVTAAPPLLPLQRDGDTGWGRDIIPWFGTARQADHLLRCVVLTLEVWPVQVGADPRSNVFLKPGQRLLRCRLGGG